MNQIKFRAWADIIEEMVEIKYLDMSKSRCEQTTKVVGYAGYAELEDDCLPYQDLMQYTGVKDRNKNEIYEGDILRLNNDDKAIGQVVYDRGCFCFVEKRDYTYFNHFKDYTYFNHFKGKQFEIIGNIYENKDLLDVNGGVGEK